MPGTSKGDLILVSTFIDGLDTGVGLEPAAISMTVSKEDPLAPKSHTSFTALKLSQLNKVEVWRAD